MQTLNWMFLGLPLLLGVCALGAEDFLAQKYDPQDGDVLLYRIYKPAKIEEQRRYPLVLFLHGAGERGSDNSAQLRHGVRDILKWSIENDEPMIIVAPQCPPRHRWVEVDWGRPDHDMPAQLSRPMQQVFGLLEKLQSELPVDKDRIYVTGLSMGGFATWDIIQRRPGIFAAAIPICGGGDAKLAGRIADIPVWAFHGSRDQVVMPERSRDMIEAMKAAGGAPRYTEYEGIGHNSWNRAYADADVLEWFFSQEKK